ncbi:MAG: PP2C family protein-serine/threonine phosphatase [Clostridia bacterium]|nr:PP2C family protein-serine/threonine phosphatase [Clostridia bacterium]
MNNQEYIKAFEQNEIEANRYAARCMQALAGIVAAVWLLNIIGLFAVPVNVMSLAAPAGILVFLTPTLLCRLVRKNISHLKYYIMLCCVLGITLLSCALPKHTIVAWAAPIIISCHYYSKHLSWGTLIASNICFTLSLIVAAYFGEWDPYLLNALPGDGPRIVTGKTIIELLQYYAFPRCMTLTALNVTCATLSTRTRKLLELQVKESAEKNRIESELNVATHIQTSMLPNNFPARDEIDLFASMDPAREVGGDFYDFFMVDERHLAIVMADVSGKGVPAALFMVIGKTLVKESTQPGRDLGEVFSRVNDLLCESNSEGLFITAFEGVLDLVTGEFTFVNAGHEMPLISRGGQPFERHKIRPGFVLAGMEGVRYRAGTLTLEPGDKLFQYTDGVTEATNLNDELYGIDRLTDVLAIHSGKRPNEILPAVRRDIDAFVGEAPQFDDITMLCFEYKARMKQDA